VESAATQGVIFVAIGALTNIAAALYHHPDLKSKVKEIVIMGGSINGDWELNFWSDRPAADFVLALDIKKTVIPMESCLDVHFTKENARSIAKWHPGKWIASMEGILFRHAWLMEKANAFIFPNNQSERKGFHPWDILAIAAVTHP